MARNVVAISGTSRPGNYTAMALAVVVDELRGAGETVTVFDARDLDLRFPGHGETADAQRLRAAVGGASGVVIASPEYHGGLCAMTKLVIENLGFPSVLAGKPVALAGVAAGRIGAIKSLEQLRAVCAHVGAYALPRAVSVAGVRAAFDDEGRCLDEDVAKSLRGLAQSLRGFLEDFVCPRFALEEAVREGDGGWSAPV